MNIKPPNVTAWLFDVNIPKRLNPNYNGHINNNKTINTRMSNTENPTYNVNHRYIRSFNNNTEMVSNHKIPTITTTLNNIQLRLITNSYKNLSNSLKQLFTKNLVEQFNLDYVDLLGCWYIPHKSTEQPEYQTTLSKIKKDWYFKKLGFNLREVEHGLTLKVNPISENDPHPNQENQEMFAEMMINKYNQRFVKPEYIYD